MTATELRGRIAALIEHWDKPGINRPYGVAPIQIGKLLLDLIDWVEGGSADCDRPVEEEVAVYPFPEGQEEPVFVKLAMNGRRDVGLIRQTDIILKPGDVLRLVRIRNIQPNPAKENRT